MRFAMKTTTLGLVLLTANMAFCQSPLPKGQAPVPGIPAARDFSKLPPGWSWKANPVPSAEPKMRVLITPQTARHLVKGQVDPRMIIHPPKSSLGVQPPGTVVARNEYPGLALRPIDSLRAPEKAVATK